MLLSNLAVGYDSTASLRVPTDASGGCVRLQLVLNCLDDVYCMHVLKVPSGLRNIRLVTNKYGKVLDCLSDSVFEVVGDLWRYKS